MPKIETLISSKNFELIRDRIAEILIDEIQGQIDLGNDIQLSALYVENHIPLDHIKLPAIIVSTSRAAYDHKSQKHTIGKYDFYIDIITKSKSTEDENGDKLSAKKVQKYVGIISTILQSPIYVTLGFERGFISNHSIQEISFGTPNENDAQNIQIGRITFHVEAQESLKYKSANVIYEFITQVTIDDSDAGYMFSGQNPPPVPPDVCNPAILKINSINFTTIPSGETYNLNVIDQDGNHVGSISGDDFIVNTSGASEQSQLQSIFIYE